MTNLATPTENDNNLLSKPDFQIVQRKYTQENSYANMTNVHFHDFYEVYYLFSGKRRYLINADFFEINAGDLVLVKKNDLHMTKEVPNTFGENIKLYLTKSFINNLGESSSQFIECFNHTHIVLPEKHKKFPNDIFNKIINETKRNDEYSIQLIRNHIYDLLSFIYRIVTVDNYNKELISANKQVNDAMRYIYTNFNKDLTLKEIAESVHLNASYFSRLFKDVIGISLTQFINRIRIKEASSMLRNTYLNITEIALHCGFDDPKYFCRVFKSITGYSAKEFRNNENLQIQWNVYN